MSDSNLFEADSTDAMAGWLDDCVAAARAALARRVGDQAAEQRLTIQTFGGLRVHYGGAEIKLCGKGRALLVALLAHGGMDVSAARIAAQLWPHGEHDYAMGALNTTLYRLRKQAGMGAALRLNDGRMSLDPEHCVVDRWLLEAALEGVDSMLVDADADREAVAGLLRVVTTAYRGPLLEQDDDELVVSARERVRARLALVLRAADRWLDVASDQTRSWLARAASFDPCPAFALG